MRNKFHKIFHPKKGSFHNAFMDKGWMDSSENAVKFM